MVNVVIPNLQPLESKGKNSRKKKGNTDLGGVLIAAVRAEGTEPCAPELERRDGSISGGVVSQSRHPPQYPHPLASLLPPFPALAFSAPWHNCYMAFRSTFPAF